MEGILRFIIGVIGLAFLFWGAMLVPIWLLKFIVSFIMFLYVRSFH